MINCGWICSRCGKSLAPWVRECDCVEVRTPYDSRTDYPLPGINWPYIPNQTSTGDSLPPPNYTVCAS